MFFAHNRLNTPPKRIVTLVPSQTELLYDLGLEQETVGITKFCIHPEEWFRSKTRIGGTKTVDIEKVRALNPDLIIANKEENVKEQIAALNDIAPVWVSDIHTLTHALGMIREIGALTFKKERADAIADRIAENFGQLSSTSGNCSCLYLIWRNPWMTVGSDTFIHDMLQRLGLRNVYSTEHRYPVITGQDIATRNPQFIFLSSEPYPFKEKHIAELQAIVPQARIILVDGEMFSWYGSRLLKAAAYFKSLLHQYGIT
jgi:ABC-type Fe3+-hydroxamate transport system substrate-binding protein